MLEIYLHFITLVTRNNDVGSSYLQNRKDRAGKCRSRIEIFVDGFCFMDFIYDYETLIIFAIFNML